MFRRTLGRDAVLWWKGDPAGSVAVVEKGRLGVRSGGRLIDVIIPGTALGEASLLAQVGAPSLRTADVVVLEDDTVVVEHPAASIVGNLATGVPHLVLRTLVGQIGRNHLVVAAAHPDHELVATLVHGVLETLWRCEAKVAGVATWDDFLVAFRVLIHLREGSDGMRDHAAADRGWKTETALGILARVTPRLATPGLSAILEQFIRAEAERLAGH